MKVKIKESTNTFLWYVFLTLVMVTSAYLGTQFHKVKLDFDFNKFFVETKTAVLKPKPKETPTPSPSNKPEATSAPSPTPANILKENDDKNLYNDQGQHVVRYNDYKNTLLIDNEKISDNVPVDPRIATDFLYDEESQTIFFIEPKGVDYAPTEFIYKAKLESEFNFKDIENIFTTNPATYQTTRIVDYTSETLILNSSSGDGCGSHGHYWTIRNGEQFILQETAAGCGDLTKPRIIEYLGEGKLLLFDLSPGAQYETESNTIEEIYIKNLIKGQIEILVTKDSFPKPLYYLDWNKENGYLFTHITFNDKGIQTNSEKYVFDLETRQFSLVQ